MTLPLIRQRFEQNLSMGDPVLDQVASLAVTNCLLLVLCRITEREVKGNSACWNNAEALCVLWRFLTI